MIRKIEDIESPFDMTDEELDHYGDEVVGNMPCDISILPMWTRARYLWRKEYQRVQSLTSNLVRVYIDKWELWVDFTNLDEPRFADNAVTVKVSDEAYMKLKGDKWREEVRKILINN